MESCGGLSVSDSGLEVGYRKLAAPNRISPVQFPKNRLTAKTHLSRVAAYCCGDRRTRDRIGRLEATDER
jgi:hypothetical protein